MAKEYTIPIDIDLTGWNPVALKRPTKGEHYVLTSGMVNEASEDMNAYWLIVEKDINHEPNP